MSLVSVINQESRRSVNAPNIVCSGPRKDSGTGGAIAALDSVGLPASAHSSQAALPIRPAATPKDPGQGRFPLGCRRHGIKKGTGESQNAKQR